MKRSHLARQAVKLGQAFGVGLIVGCAAVPPANGSQAMADIGPTKTICAGRLQIDVPSDATISISAQFRGVGAKRGASVRDLGSLEQEYAAQAQSLEREKMEDPRSPYAKKLAQEGKLDQASSRLVGMTRDDTTSSLTIGTHRSSSSSEIDIELHKVVGWDHFVFSKRTLGASKYEAARESLASTAAQFVPLAPAEVPKQSGFCVDGGYFADRGDTHANEEFTLVVEFPNRSDTRFTIDARAIDVPDDEEPLEQRADRDLAVMRQEVRAVEVLERGHREVAGQSGYQIAIGAPYDESGARIRKFFWGAQGVPNDVSRPFLEVDLISEPNDGKASFSDDAEAKVLWDRLLGSLRIRPGAV